MADDEVRWDVRRVDKTLGNFEKVKVAELIGEFLAHSKVSAESFQWWSDIESKLLKGAEDDDVS